MTVGDFSLSAMNGKTKTMCWLQGQGSELEFDLGTRRKEQHCSLCTQTFFMYWLYARKALIKLPPRHAGYICLGPEFLQLYNF